MLRSTLVMAVVLVTAGCGPSPSAPAAPTSDAPATSSPTSSPTLSGSPPGPAATELAVGRNQLAPGAYTVGGFDPRITLEVERDWFADEVAADFVKIHSGEDPDPASVVQLAMVDAPTAFAAVEAIRGNDAVDVLGESDSRVGGYSGLNLEIENRGDGSADVLDTASGPIAVDPAHRLWISLFDTRGGVLAITVGGSTAGWEEALAIAERVLESIIIAR